MDYSRVNLFTRGVISDYLQWTIRKKQWPTQIVFMYSFGLVAVMIVSQKMIQKHIAADAIHVVAAHVMHTD